jgi:hypothetical protein
VAAIFISPVEEPWGTAFLQAWDRAVAEGPHGLDLSMDYTESVAPPDAERVLREFAASGQYDIVYTNTAPHATSYYRFMITEPGFDARTDSLSWDSARSRCSSA